MPPILRALSDVSCLAQYSLHGRLAELPANYDAHTQQFKFTWSSHFKCHASVEGAGAEAPPLSILSSSAPEFRGVRKICYPDGLPMELGWQWKGTMINPFFFEPHRCRDLFTRQLPKGQGLPPQWMMHHPSEGEVLARQSEIPPQLAKLGWWTFGTVRANPGLQLRRLATTLLGHEQGRRLDLHSEALLNLALQASTQIGPCVAGELPAAAAWKQDLGVQEWMEDFAHGLSDRAQELAHKRRGHQALLLLVVVANYLVQWHEAPFQRVLRSCWNVAERWAAQVAELLQNTAHEDTERLAELRCLRCTFAVYELLARRVCPKVLDAVAAARLLELRVRIAESALLDQALDQELACWVSETMLHREAELVASCAGPGGCTILGGAARVVVPWVEADLLWHQVDAGPLFTTTSKSGDVFHVHLHTGVVRQNGLQSGRLPDAIQKHGLYARVFGKAFSPPVMQTSPTEFRSKEVFADRFYRFAATASGALLIRELKTADADDGVLLIPPGLVALPPPLVEACSHWLDCATGRLEVRPEDCRQKAPLFVAQLRRVGSLLPSLSLYADVHRVADKRRLLPTLATELRPITTVLSKFDDAQYILCFGAEGTSETASGPCELQQVEFFRDGCSRLTFHVGEGGELGSVDFRGYTLRPCQQVETLLGMEQYLVLRARAPTEGQRPETVVLIPNAMVQPAVPMHVQTSTQGRIVYRALAGQDDPDKGLRPKNPSSALSLADHVEKGWEERVASRYLSATLDPVVALLYSAMAIAKGAPLEGLRIAAIDLAMLPDATEVVDISDNVACTAAGLPRTGRASHLGIGHRMVCLAGDVPAAAIVSVVSWLQVLEASGCEAKALIPLQQHCQRIREFREHVPSALQEALFKALQPRRSGPDQAESGRSPEFFAFALDREVGRLKSERTDARLLLAACYAKCHSALPDPLTGATGVEAAIEELLHCWQNKPYTEREHEVMSEIFEEGSGRKLALRCLANLLWADSQDTYFMHGLERPQQFCRKWDPEEDTLELACRVRELMPTSAWLPAAAEMQVFGGQLLGRDRALNRAAPGATDPNHHFEKAAFVLFAPQLLRRDFAAELKKTSFYMKDVACEAPAGSSVLDWDACLRPETFLALYSEAAAAAAAPRSDGRQAFFLKLAFYAVCNSASIKDETWTLLQVLFLVSQHGKRPSIPQAPRRLLSCDTVPRCSTHAISELTSRIASINDDITSELRNPHADHLISALRRQAQAVETKRDLAQALSDFFDEVGASCNAARSLVLAPHLPRVLANPTSPELPGVVGAAPSVGVSLCSNAVGDDGLVASIEAELRSCWRVGAATAATAGEGEGEGGEARAAELAARLDAARAELKRVSEQVDRLRQRAARRDEAADDEGDEMQEDSEEEGRQAELQSREARLRKEVKFLASARGRARIDLTFPLGGSVPPLADDDVLQRPLGRSMMGELRESWLLYMQELARPKAVLLRRDSAWYHALLARVQEMRRTAWIDLRAAVDALPGGAHGAALRLARLGRVTPEATTQQVLRWAVAADDDDLAAKVAEANPAIKPSEAPRIREYVILCLVLGTYEHKILRLLARLRELPGGDGGGVEMGGGNDGGGGGGHSLAEGAVVEELQTIRTWDPHLCPEWLVLEFESGITIRKRQVDVARVMCQTNHELFQLNMGEGKSKVILPMLVAKLADGNRLVRANVPSSLVAVSVDHFRQVFGGLLRRHIFVLPFRRDCPVAEEPRRVLARQLARCRADGGLLVAAPEHRLSLVLKHSEAACRSESADAPAAASAARRGLQELVGQKVCEVMDECDELLKTTYQLIYTDGSQQPVQAAPERWLAPQALLRLLATDSALQQLRLWKEQGLVWMSRPSPEQFPLIRLLDAAAVFPQLREMLVEALLRDPPLELGSIRQLSASDKAVAHRLLLEPKMQHRDLKSAKELFLSRGGEKTTLWTTLLIIRGLLVYGVLDHCLARRHRVQFGLDPHSAKRLAVPFRAKDAPVDRTEFGHPDVQICHTLQSYYSDGLSREQVQESFALLLRLGENELQERYRTWLQLSSPRMSPEDKEALLTPSRIDCQDADSLDALYRNFRGNFEVVNFWLNSVVFPSDCMQYPHRLVASAWHLAEGEEVHGFSGTNDNRPTLPIHVEQKELKHSRSTNGKLVQVLTDPALHNTAYRVISNSEAADASELLDFVASKASVLLDAGAVVTGLANRDVCRAVLASQSPAAQRFQGAVFFDERGGIAVLDRRGREWPLASSPAQPRSCFTYLDELHTRGTDLKFAKDAVAVLTLGKGMTKDKLVQAAMRLRQLGVGQSVLLCGTEEVTRSIVQTTGVPRESLDSRAVLLWACVNTVEQQEEALVQWSSQGAVHTRQVSVRRLLEDEGPGFLLARELLLDADVLDLEEMYGRPLEKLRADTLVCTKMEQARMNLCRVLQPHAQAAQLAEEAAKGPLRQIKQRADDYLSQRWVVRSSLDEEYERELEKVEEEEREIERPGVQQARQESDWDWHRVVEVSFIESCSGSASGSGRYPKLVELTRDFERTHVLSNWLASLQVKFHPALRATENFTRTVNLCSDADEFLRPPEFVLSHCCAASGAAAARPQQGGAPPYTRATTTMQHHYVLLSGREAEHVLAALRRADPKQAVAHLHELARPFAPSSFPPPPLRPRTTAEAGASDRDGSDAELWTRWAQLQLFAGDCQYSQRRLQLGLGAFLGMLQPGLMPDDMDPAVAVWLCDRLRDEGVLGANGFVLQVASERLRLDGKDADGAGGAAAAAQHRGCPDGHQLPSAAEVRRMTQDARRGCGFSADPSSMLKDLVGLRGRLMHFPLSDLDKMLMGAGEAPVSEEGL
ncbi:unnamed protein product [Prorocentrum cordatum]|uniref:ubiquitinyl hydrolase 1 n=1 Tax=Prorocentrum cordatum TaxID=2364126 RepID=A0ABN9UV97_9DINO|nr:unnamed protein product [Polarella glacialis]